MGEELPEIPGRDTILFSSWVFVAASLLLLAEFVLIYLGAAQELYYESEAKVAWATPHVVSILGVLEAVGWALGFVALIDWLVWHAFDAWGKDRGALWAAALKLVASVFFCVQPASQPGDPRSAVLVKGLGCAWSNFAGICFFHAGNVADALRVPLPDGLAHANWPSLGMYVYVSATWLLVAADALAYFDFKGSPYGAPAAPKIGRRQLELICPLQMAGASLLAVGSLIYVAWARRGRAPAAAGDRDAPLLGAVQA